MGMSNKPARKKPPVQLAVVDQNGCTGCEACTTVCPVDCIEVIPGPDAPGLMKLVEIDLDRCIGCTLCVKMCPWDTIAMHPTAQALVQAPSVTIRSIVPGHQAGASGRGSPSASHQAGAQAAA